MLSRLIKPLRLAVEWQNSISISELFAGDD
jgi:hypothetical protein